MNKKSKETHSWSVTDSANKAIEKICDEFYFLAEAVELIAEIFKEKDDVGPSRSDSNLPLH
ncbi:MAG: hypothetical protein IT291_01460 [Deltaproteobacteria bacterium]|nr:hypothetical protein [Deltaproteobacteria bacterium]